MTLVSFESFSFVCGGDISFGGTGLGIFCDWYDTCCLGFGVFKFSSFTSDPGSLGNSLVLLKKEKNIKWRWSIHDQKHINVNATCISTYDILSFVSCQNHIEFYLGCQMPFISNGFQ